MRPPQGSHTAPTTRALTPAANRRPTGPGRRKHEPSLRPNLETLPSGLPRPSLPAKHTKRVVDPFSRRRPDTRSTPR